MKRIGCLSLALGLLLLCACGGKTGDAQVRVGSSELYSREELLKAADAVMDDFQKGFDDCKLLRLEYSESHTLREAEYRKSHYGEEAVAVFLADFYVGMDAMAVGALIPGRTCTNYQFILSRNDRGEWEVRDRGYA